jgi:hypothetical protein
MQHLRVTHPALDMLVDVIVHELDRRYMATADLGEGSRDVGVGDMAQEAVRFALRSSGEPYATTSRCDISAVDTLIARLLIPTLGMDHAAPRAFLWWPVRVGSKGNGSHFEPRHGRCGRW